jgi:transcriptional regulator with XRE-family HTH domain
MSIDVTPSATASLSERVAEEIRVLLARRRIRQSQLARELGQSEQWVSVRLRGVQPIDLNDLQRIAEVLGVTPTELLPRASSAPKPASLTYPSAQVRPRTPAALITGHHGVTTPRPAGELRRPVRVG